MPSVGTNRRGSADGIGPEARALSADELTTSAGTQPYQAAHLLREAGHCRDNHRRMNYLEMGEEEWHIDSGMVESGCTQF